MRSYLPVLDMSGLSDVGPVREENQDAIHLSSPGQSPVRGSLFAIADGMGGYSNGSIASTLALKSMNETLFGARALNPKMLRQSFENANLNVYKAAQRMGMGQMGTTLTAACIIGNVLYLAHVGDSRAYLIRDRRATCLTRDHTRAGELVQAKLISPGKVRSHAQRSVLTRAIGLTLFVQPDITQIRLQEGDWLVLCSDGVWSMVEDDEFAWFAGQSGDASQLGEKLLHLALERETDDNVSTVVVRVRRFEAVETEVQRIHDSNLGTWLSRFLPGR